MKVSEHRRGPHTTLGENRTWGSSACGPWVRIAMLPHHALLAWTEVEQHGQCQKTSPRKNREGEADEHEPWLKAGRLSWSVTRTNKWHIARANSQ